MDIAQQAMITDNIRETLRGYLGQRLGIRANLGRSKIVESIGTLTQVHPALFIIEVERRRGRTARQSYQYVDVLTGVVELSKDGEPIFGKFVEDDEPDEDDMNSLIDSIMSEDALDADGDEDLGNEDDVAFDADDVDQDSADAEDA